MESFRRYLKWEELIVEAGGIGDGFGFCEFESTVCRYLKGLIDEGRLRESERGQLVSLLDGILGRVEVEGVFRDKVVYYRNQCVG